MIDAEFWNLVGTLFYTMTAIVLCGLVWMLSGRIDDLEDKLEVALRPKPDELDMVKIATQKRQLVQKMHDLD